MPFEGHLLDLPSLAWGRSQVSLIQAPQEMMHIWGLRRWAGPGACRTRVFWGVTLSRYKGLQKPKLFLKMLTIRCFSKGPQSLLYFPGIPTQAVLHSRYHLITNINLTSNFRNFLCKWICTPPKSFPPFLSVPGWSGKKLHSSCDLQRFLVSRCHPRLACTRDMALQRLWNCTWFPLSIPPGIAGAGTWQKPGSICSKRSQTIVNFLVISGQVSGV